MKFEAGSQATKFWDSAAEEFDSIYTGVDKNTWGRFLDRVFRKDIYQRFDWVMDKCGDLCGKTACDIGCGPGHFVTEFAKRGAALSIGLDLAEDLLLAYIHTCTLRVDVRVAGQGRCEFVRRCEQVVCCGGVYEADH